MVRTVCLDNEIKLFSPRVCYNLMIMNTALILFEVDVKFLVVITVSMNLSNVSRRICE